MLPPGVAEQHLSESSGSLSLPSLGSATCVQQPLKNANVCSSDLEAFNALAQILFLAV